MSFSFSPTYAVNFVPTLHQSVPEAFKPESNPPLPSPFVVVITGASRGLGRATAQVFARAGATGLILTARSASGALEETKKQCEAAARSPELLKVSILAAEADDEAGAKRIADVVQTEHGGRLDLLINNAGVVSTEASAWGPLQGIRADQIRAPIGANYVGRFLAMQHLLPALLDPSHENSAKTVINVTSVCSHFTGFGALGFNVSALATNRLTEFAAETYAGRGLRCYAVHPGTVRTTPPPGMHDAALKHAVDDPDLCGAMYLWLARERPEWLSGRYLSAEWDIDELKQKREEILQGDKLKFRMVV